MKSLTAIHNLGQHTQATKITMWKKRIDSYMYRIRCLSADATFIRQFRLRKGWLCRGLSDVWWHGMLMWHPVIGSPPVGHTLLPTLSCYPCGISPTWKRIQWPVEICYITIFIGEWKKKSMTSEEIECGPRHYRPKNLRKSLGDMLHLYIVYLWGMGWLTS